MVFHVKEKDLLEGIPRAWLLKEKNFRGKLHSQEWSKISNLIVQLRIYNYEKLKIKKQINELEDDIKNLNESIPLTILDYIPAKNNTAKPFERVIKRYKKMIKKTEASIDELKSKMLEIDDKFEKLKIENMDQG